MLLIGIIVPAIAAATYLFFMSPGGAVFMSSVSTPARESIPSEDEVPTPVIVERTNALPEVRVFLNKYPQADVIPRGLEQFSNEYYMTKERLTGVAPTYNQTYFMQPQVSLRVYLDTEGYPMSSELRCTTDRHGQFRADVNGDNISGHLESVNCKIS
jgi:hypothetical protein